MNYLALTFAFVVMTADGALAVDYNWVPVQKSGALSGIPLSGRVVPQDGALNIVSARVQGRVISIMRREGERVSEETPIYSIASGECSSLQEEKRVAASKVLAELIEGVNKRERQLGLKLAGDQCYAVAGNSGVITKKNLEAGSSFNVGDPIATVLDPRRLTIEFDVPERDHAEVRPGMAVSFQFASNPKDTYTSEILTTVPTIDPTTRTSKARIKAVRLPTNISVEALVLGEVKSPQGDSLLQVPSTALAFSKNQQYVISGDKDHPKKVAVTVVSETDKVSTIRPAKRGELKADDLIVEGGAIYLLQKLENGN